ncbi:MAG: Na/Pi cotransporter family protein [candidate division WOR-3 bacterium]
MRRRAVLLLAMLVGIGLARQARPLLGFAVEAGETTAGDRQAREAGMELAKPLVVQVMRGDEPVESVPVRFEVVLEPKANRFGGRPARLSDTLVYTNSRGFARTRLVLGTAAGEYQVRASALNQEIVFAATGLPRRWYLVTAVEMVGGLCLFLFGLYYGSKGLRRLAGEKIRELLFGLTRRRTLGAIVGIGVTVIFQSSSATITLLVSMASAGLLNLTQSLGVILGADIGTTITVQILAFRFFDYALIVAVIGFVLMNSARRLRDIGQAVFGFGLVFYSLKVVLTAAEPLRYMPPVQAAVADMARVPLLAFLAAVLFTALFRSSAATIGVVVGLSFAGLVDLRTAVPFILGANVGTTFNAVLASWRGTTEAKRIALGHVLFKVLIVVLLLPFLPWLVRLFAFSARTVPRQIANAHTLINVMAAVLFLPLLVPFQRLLERLVPEQRNGRAGLRFLQADALAAPELAVAQTTREVQRMGDIVLDMFTQALPVFLSGDKEGRRRIIAADDEVDRLEESITAFLAKVPQEGIGPELSKRTVALFYVTDELEHIGDIISKNLMNYARRKINENLAFSDEGLADISGFHQEVKRRLEMANAALATWDRELSERLMQERQWGVDRKRELHNRHLDRLSAGLKETIDTSTIHLDIIADLERINFHCSQIGEAIAGRHSRPAVADNGTED